MEEGKRVIQRGSAVRKRDDRTSPWAKVGEVDRMRYTPPEVSTASRTRTRHRPFPPRHWGTMSGRRSLGRLILKREREVKLQNNEERYIS